MRLLAAAVPRSVDVLIRLANAVLLGISFGWLVEAALQVGLESAEGSESVDGVVTEGPQENAEGAHLAGDDVGQGPVTQEEGNLRNLSEVLVLLVMTKELLSESDLVFLEESGVVVHLLEELLAAV